jgi:hypothetical protein
MKENRIDSPCWYCHNKKARGGYVRMWAIEGNLEDGIDPCAVVEDDKTHHVTTVYVSYVSFAAVPPWPLDTDPS